MTLEQLHQKLKTLLEDNRIPGTTEVSTEFVEADSAENDVVGVDTRMEWGRHKIVVLVQSCY